MKDNPGISDLKLDNRGNKYNDNDDKVHFYIYNRYEIDDIEYYNSYNKDNDNDDKEYSNSYNKYIENLYIERRKKVTMNMTMMIYNTTIATKTMTMMIYDITIVTQV